MPKDIQNAVHRRETSQQYMIKVEDHPENKDIDNVYNPRILRARNSKSVLQSPPQTENGVRKVQFSNLEKVSGIDSTDAIQRSALTSHLRSNKNLSSKNLDQTTNFPELRVLGAETRGLSSNQSSAKQPSKVAYGSYLTNSQLNEEDEI